MEKKDGGVLRAAERIHSIRRGLRACRTGPGPCGKPSSLREDGEGEVGGVEKGVGEWPVVVWGQLWGGMDDADRSLALCV